MSPRDILYRGSTSVISVTWATMKLRHAPKWIWHRRLIPFRSTLIFYDFLQNNIRRLGKSHHFQVQMLTTVNGGCCPSCVCIHVHSDYLVFTRRKIKESPTSSSGLKKA